MPSNKTRRWPFTKKGMITGTASQKSQAAPDIKSWNIYRRITEMPLARWIDLTVDGYTKALVKEGEPPEHELRIAEQDLRIQYSDAAGDQQYRLYINLSKEITELEITLLQIEKLIDTLRTAYHPVLAKELNRVGRFSLVYDVTKPKQYDENLDRAFRRSRGLNVTLQLKRIKITEIEKKYSAKNGGPVTREYYMGMLIVLSDEAGYPLNDQITVWEFLERIRRYNIKHTPPLKLKKKNG